ncbi:DHH family phosphoesterase [Patescibacteria group bacterium]|nr:DHH family phosphoesterase [Patescibacteria group bacterium]
MKYDSQLGELKNLLPSAKNILIAVPYPKSAIKLAAGLSLFLTLEASGKQVSVVCDDNILVGQAHLFGIDHVQKNLPSTEGGNLTLTLEGVAASDGTVPALEKLDWFAESNNLNLVFHVLPGQTFQPGRIIPRYQGSGFDVVFTIGAANLNALGNIYTQNQNAFSGTHVVNIDNQPTNSSFGQTNVLDQNASSLSEIVANLIADLGYVLDKDTASNLLAGTFDSTNNLQDQKVTADTYMVVANCLRVGGRKPGVEQVGASTPQSVISQAQPTYDWNAVSAALGQNLGSQTPSTPQPTTPVSSTSAAQPSPEERPAGEGVISETVEPEWLTPKIFKGSSLG